MRRLALMLALALLLPFALAACGDDPGVSDPDAFDEDQSEGASEDASESAPPEEIAMVEGDAGVKVTGAAGAKPVIELPGGAEPPKELLYSDLIVGDGPEAPEGASVSMHYVGIAWSNGEQFDAS